MSHGDLSPKEYPASVVTMVWGGKGANGTWFSATQSGPRHQLAAVHAAARSTSGAIPEYCAKNYAALVAENKEDDEKKAAKAGKPLENKDGRTWDQWADIIWMYRATQRSGGCADAIRGAPRRTSKPEAGNSLANTYVVADHARGVSARSIAPSPPTRRFYAVFSDGKRRTHVAYNAGEKPRVVTFSDGLRVTCGPRAFAVQP